MSSDAGKRIEDLISRVALGNRTAFSELYDETSSKLLAVCLRVLKDRSAAEDAVQEVYVKVWNAADKYQITGHSPMTWLITIARNTAIDRLRAGRQTEDIADHDHRLADSDPTPEQAVIAASEAALVQKCLNEMDADRRAAVTGAYLDGRSYKDLAEHFGIPLNTIRTWLRRGLASLRECVQR